MLILCVFGSLRLESLKSTCNWHFIGIKILGTHFHNFMARVLHVLHLLDLICAVILPDSPGGPSPVVCTV